MVGPSFVASRRLSEDGTAAFNLPSPLDAPDAIMELLHEQELMPENSVSEPARSSQPSPTAADVRRRLNGWCGCETRETSACGCWQIPPATGAGIERDFLGAARTGKRELALSVPPK